EKAAREMFRVLDNEGKAVLVLHHPNSPLFEEKTLVEVFGVDDRPLKTKLSDCENVLRHLLRAGSLARGGKRLGIPRFQSGYMDKVSYARLLERKPPSSVAAKRAFDELLLTRIRNDIGRFRALLILLLLQHVKTNLFSNADEINRFFNDVGFHVDEVKPLKANVKGSPEVSYGVVLRKIGKTEDIPVSDRTQTTPPAAGVAVCTITDRKHMAELVEYAKEKLATGELHRPRPVVARIADRNGNEVATAKGEFRP
ncbi:unnamed protein product, partial [marine sediment metagenome]